MMKKQIQKIVYYLFPLFECRRANKKISKAMQELDRENINCLVYMAGYDKLSQDDANVFLSKTMENKKTIEDKAKANLFGVTVSITIITGLAKMLFDLNNDVAGYTSWKIMLCFLAIAALFYMTLAGVLSMKTLGELNIVYELFPEDMALEAQEKLKKTAFQTEKNAKMNTMRNNYIYTSYRNIINSLICLCLLFLLLTVPYRVKTNPAVTPPVMEQSVTQEIYNLRCEFQAQSNLLIEIQKVQDSLIMDEKR